MYEVPFVLSPTRSGHLGAACRNSFGLSRASADAASLKAMLNLKMNGPPPALNFAPLHTFFHGKVLRHTGRRPSVGNTRLIVRTTLTNRPDQGS